MNETAAGFLANWARLNAEFGVKSDVREGATAALAMSQGPAVIEDAAASLALIGDDKRAEALMNDLARKRPDDQWIHTVYLPWLNAIVAMNHGEAAKAIELLRPALPYRPSLATLDVAYVRGRAYLQAGQAKEAAQQFQNILAVRMFLPSAPEMVLAQLGLARAYAAMGQKDKARAAYQDVLATWKDADAGVPLIEQAKTEYAKLR